MKTTVTRRQLIRNILLAGGFAPALLAVLRGAGAEGLVTGGVREFRGRVRIDDRPVRLGQPVRPGNVVSTGADGSCVIVIGQHVVLIHENAEIEFFAEDFRQDEDGHVSGLIRIFAGAMLSVFGPTETRITTPFATIGIRGTACYVDSRAHATYACVCYGTADLGDAAGTKLETVVTRHHDSPRLIYGPAPATRIMAAAVVDHTDGELRMLEALVDRRPPFDAPGAGPAIDY